MCGSDAESEPATARDGVKLGVGGDGVASDAVPISRPGCSEMVSEHFCLGVRAGETARTPAMGCHRRRLVFKLHSWQ